MRLLLALAALALPLVSAEAGTRAVYRMQDGAQLLVEVDDSGAARVQEAGSGDYGIARDDGFYMVGAEGGALQVARVQDIAAAIDRVVSPLFAGALGPAVQPAPLRSEAKGERSVAGVAGKAVDIYGLDPADPAKAERFVVSTDPKLAPVGRALEGFMNAAVVPSAPLVGPGVRDLILQTRAIFALGTPLDAGGRFALKSIETVPIGADRTALPAKPETPAEIEAALRQALAQAKPAAR